MAGPAYDYAFYGLAAGNYKVEFSEGGPWLPEFYNDKRTMDEADVIVYDGATPQTGIDCTFDSKPVSISGTLHSADELNSCRSRSTGKSMGHGSRRRALDDGGRARL